MYLNKSVLSAEILSHQQTGEMSERLVSMLYQMADGIQSRYCRTADPDDYRQTCVVRYIECATVIDVEQNVFCYLTSVFVNFGRQSHRDCRRVTNLPTNDAGKIMEEDWHTPAEFRDRRVKGPPRTPPAWAYQGVPMTLEEVSDASGVSVTTIKGRIQKYGGRVSRVLPGLTRIGKPDRRKYYEFDGIKWTVEELAEMTGLSVSGFKQRLWRHKGDVVKAMSQQSNPGKAHVAKKVTYRGEQYTVRQLAAKLGVSEYAVYEKLRRYGGDADKAYAADRPPQPQRSVYYRGVKYRSVVAFARAVGMSGKTMSDRMRRAGWDAEKAMAGGPNDMRSVTYQGVTYRSVRALASAVGINPRTLAERLKKNGYDVEAAVSYRPPVRPVSDDIGRSVRNKPVEIAPGGVAVD